MQQKFKNNRVATVMEKSWIFWNFENFWNFSRYLILATVSVYKFM